MRSQACHPDEVRETLAASFTAKTDRSGKYSLDSLIRQGQCFKVMEGDTIVGAYVLKADGIECYVLAAAGRCDGDLTAAMLAFIEDNGAEFDSIGFQTRRRGLVKKAQKHGYEIAGYIMRKKLR